MWTGLYPTLSTGGRCIALSTPNGVGNWFHKTCVDAEIEKNDFPPKELRNIVDQSKKDIKEGIVVGFSTFEGKVGVAVGVTSQLTKKYDAVSLVKIASEVLGGKGGGGRKDFAQAGGTNKDKIQEAFNETITIPHSELVESLNVACVAVPLLLERKRVAYISNINK